MGGVRNSKTSKSEIKKSLKNGEATKIKMLFYHFYF